MISLELEISYPDESMANAVMDSLEPDNIGYVESEIRDGILVFRISADNAGTLRNAADDLLACIKVAEASIGVATTE